MNTSSIVVIILAGSILQHNTICVRAYRDGSLGEPLSRLPVAPVCGSVEIRAVELRGAVYAKNNIFCFSNSPGGMGSGGRSLLGFIRPPQSFSAYEVFCLDHTRNCRGRRSLGVDLRSCQNRVKKDSQIRLTGLRLYRIYASRTAWRPTDP